MVRCNLSVLLAERKLKISKVAADTGISRTTLTALFYNHSQGIQFDTLNSLCSYLSVTPSQLVSWVPIDIWVEDIDVNQDLGGVGISFGICQGGRKEICNIHGMLQLGYTNGFVDDICVDLYLWDEAINPPEVKEENAILKRAFQQIPTPFLRDLEEKIYSLTVDDCWINEHVNIDDADPIGFRLTWPPELRPNAGRVFF